MNVRLFKVELYLTCQPDEEKGEVYCDKHRSCNECLSSIRLVEKIIGPNFVVQKLHIEEITDLTVVE